MSEATAICEPRLTELRAAGVAARSRFVDPRTAHRLQSVLTQRGEKWAAAVLGRDLSRRSLAAPTMPWLNDGEMHTLIAADAEEDRIRFDEITSGTTPTESNQP